LERFPTLRRFWIEDKASGMGLIQEINKDISDAGLPRMSIMPFQKGARQNKSIMNNDAANYFKESRVWLPKLTPWLNEVVGELLSFDPSNKHATDDICDTVAMACKVLLTHRSNAFMNL
jgi:predicted phage terminase large subunit-like protein